MVPWAAWGLNLPLLALAAGWLWRRTARGAAGARWFWLALAARGAGGIALGLAYTVRWGVYDGGDTYGLQRQARKLTAWAETDWSGYVRLLLTATDQPGAPTRLYATFSNSFFFIRGLSLLNFLTGGSYWLNGLWLSLAAFAGSWLLARELARVVPRAARGAWIGALAWPSVVFWLSGVGKDALLLAALGSFGAAALRLTYPPISSVDKVVANPAAMARGQTQRWWWVVLLMTGWLLWKIKFFIAAVVFVLLGALAVTEQVAPRWRRRWPWLRPWQLLLLSALALAPLSRVAHRAFRPEYLLIQVPRNQAALRSNEAARPELRLTLAPSLTSLAANAPAAAIGTFTRPWLTEGTGWHWWAAGLENFVLLLLTAWSVAGWWRRGHTPNIPLLAVALLLLVLTVAVMFGLTTPNLGTLHRYRAVLLPFVLFLLDWLRVGRGETEKNGVALE